MIARPQKKCTNTCVITSNKEIAAEDTVLAVTLKKTSKSSEDDRLRSNLKRITDYMCLRHQSANRSFTHWLKSTEKLP
jgi:hypothetical protein